MKENQDKLVKFSHDSKLGFYIPDLIYKTEMNLAILFNREKGDQLLWIPKSAINGDWIKDREKNR